MKGFTIHVVPVGTEIKNDAGDCLTVTETNAVRAGNKLYMTKERNSQLTKAICEQPFPVQEGQQHDR